MSMPQLASWLVLGLLAGAIARALTPGDEKAGCMATILLGLAGALVGGWIGSYTGFLPKTEGHLANWEWIPSLGSLVTSTVGAIVLLAGFRWLRK
jgi:uncharacterized membrane protein YeaQ/YmgE (transglycosylase-associated protein family)